MILVECFPDQALLTVIGFGGSIRHMKGKGNIFNRLGSEPGDIGVMDLDPGSTRPKQLIEYREMSRSLGIISMEHVKLRTRVIMLEPDLEGWLIERLISNGLRPSSYGLPDDPFKLHRRPRYDRDPGFIRCLGDLMLRDDGLRRLKTLLDGAP